jgi:hypothetical protein
MHIVVLEDHGWLLVVFHFHFSFCDFTQIFLRALALFSVVTVTSSAVTDQKSAADHRHPEYARLRRVATFAYANSASQSEAMREREGRRWSKQDHLVSTLATLAYEVNIVRDRYVRLTLFCSF